MKSIIFNIDADIHRRLKIIAANESTTIKEIAQIAILRIIEEKESQKK